MAYSNELGGASFRRMALAATLILAACSDNSSPAAGNDGGPGGGGGPGAGSDGGSGGPQGDDGGTGPTNWDQGPPAGNPDGHAAVPPDARAADVSQPRTVVGNGSKESCTADAFAAAVAKGGVVTFNCGADPVTITLPSTVKVRNDTGSVVIDGGGKVTLSGGGKVRILYMNTCEGAQGNTQYCDSAGISLTLQNLTFAGGSAKGYESDQEHGGGGAVYMRGARLKVVSSRFFGNVCDDMASDLGGGAIRVLDFKPGDSASRPVYIVGSTFGGGAQYANKCANGGAISSIGASYTIINSLFTDEQAVGSGANDGNGGNGGAIYNDGNTYTLTLMGTRIEGNHANEGGSAIFYVSNDQTGSLIIDGSVLKNNPKGNFETDGYPGIFFKGKDEPRVTNSTIQ